MVVSTSCEGGSAQGTGGNSGTISGELTGLCDGLEGGVKERQKSRKTPDLGRPGLFLSLRWTLQNTERSVITSISERAFKAVGQSSLTHKKQNNREHDRSAKARGSAPKNQRSREHRSLHGKSQRAEHPRVFTLRLGSRAAGTVALNSFLTFPSPR